MEIKQNTLYLTTAGLYIARDHLTLRIEFKGELKLAVPIHHLESVCVFGPITLSPQALALCWEHGVGVNHFSENGYFMGRWEGVPNTSVTLRRLQYRAADDTSKACGVAKQCIAGKIQNSRQSLMRSAREAEKEEDAAKLRECAESLGHVLRRLETASNIDEARGHEGIAANHYFGVFSFHFKKQRADFDFTTRSRRPPRDAINCVLSFLYALLTHDCIAALTATGLDPFVGYLHSERANRPSLALDLMEEFRPLIADRLAITLVNRKQITKNDFKFREGGAVELDDKARKALLVAYQERKQETVTHPLIDQEFRIGQLYLVQARIFSKYLRGDLESYLPCVLK